jgi:hypothetical protein
MGSSGGKNPIGKQNSQRDLKLNLGKLSRSNLLVQPVGTPSSANTSTPTTTGTGTPSTAPLNQSGNQAQLTAAAPLTSRFDEKYLSGKIRVQNLLMAMIKEKALENKLSYSLLNTEHIINLLDALFEAYQFAHRVLNTELVREAIDSST